MTAAAPRDPLPISVVICTKDRPRDLALCLDSLRLQTRAAREVIVVDAGSPPAVSALARFARLASAATPVRHIEAAPGLPRQRNVGARAARGEVVLFLDDDTVLDARYLEEIWAVFAADPERRIGGVGGALDPDPTPRERAPKRALRRAFLLPAHGRGRVKRSGHPELVFAPRERLEVEFLSGCNMSFRREVLDEIRFDERLSGYALGEDLHFSYQVSRRWRLVLTPRARLDHRESGGGRPPGAERVEMAVRNRSLFFREQIARGPRDWLCYAWSAAGDVLWSLRHPGGGQLAGRLRGYAGVAREVLARALRDRGGASAGLPDAAAGPGHPGAAARCAPAALAATSEPTVLPASHAPAGVDVRAHGPTEPPLVTVVVPARDEERYLSACLDSLLAQSYPAARTEILVVDNRSRDRTPEIVASYAQRDPRVRLLSCDGDNQAAAMNLGVRAARGEIVARVDAHGSVARDYLCEVVALFERDRAAVAAGGPYRPGAQTPIERVTALARSSRLGVGGGWYADKGTEEHAVRTVGCPAYRRSALLAAGLFDPAMAYGEDDELHWRLAKAGGRIVCSPRLEQVNRSRATLGGLARQYWNYGRGRFRVLQKHPDFLLPKHLVPAALVATLLALLALVPLVAASRAALAGVLGAYAVVLVAAALGAASHGAREALLVPCAVAVIHAAYGGGMIYGALAHLFDADPRARRARELPAALAGCEGKEIS